MVDASSDRSSKGGTNHSRFLAFPVLCAPGTLVPRAPFSRPFTAARQCSTPYVSIESRRTYALGYTTATVSGGTFFIEDMGGVCGAKKKKSSPGFSTRAHVSSRYRELSRSSLHSGTSLALVDFIVFTFRETFLPMCLIPHLTSLTRARRGSFRCFRGFTASEFLFIYFI